MIGYAGLSELNRQLGEGGCTRSEDKFFRVTTVRWLENATDAPTALAKRTAFSGKLVNIISVVRCNTLRPKLFLLPCRIIFFNLLCFLCKFIRSNFQGVFKFFCMFDDGSVIRS